MSKKEKKTLIKIPEVDMSLGITTKEQLKALYQKGTPIQRFFYFFILPCLFLFASYNYIVSVKNSFATKEERFLEDQEFLNSQNQNQKSPAFLDSIYQIVNDSSMYEFENPMLTKEDSAMAILDSTCNCPE